MIDLVFAILYHTLLGLGLAALVWGVGAGCVRGRGDSLDGYPFGLILVIAAAFLFLLTPWLGIPAFLLASIVAGLRLVSRGRSNARRWTPLIAIVALASLAYPSFPIESPPVALALPLAFVVYRLWDERISFERLAVLSVVVGVDLL